MLRSWLWGPLSPLGLGIAALTLIFDQAHKAWMLYVYDIGAKSPVAVAPFFDLVLVWNQGISYGLLPQESPAGRWGLILFAFGASLALAVWLARLTSPVAAASISPTWPLLPGSSDFYMTPCLGVTKRPETLLRCNEIPWFRGNEGNLGAHHARI
jgi:hypothetical protein